MDGGPLCIDVESGLVGYVVHCQTENSFPASLLIENPRKFPTGLFFRFWLQFRKDEHATNLTIASRKRCGESAVATKHET
jgi:hypothetical protein